MFSLPPGRSQRRSPSSPVWSVLAAGRGIPLPAWSLVALTLSLAPSRAQLEVGIDSPGTGGGGVDLGFAIQDLSVLPGGAEPSGFNGLVLQYSTNLLDWTTVDPGDVALVPPTSTTPPPGGMWTAALNSGDGTGFFQFLGVVTTDDDSDGDGVSNAYENGPFGTLATHFDTDGDSFSDGVELLYGTDPNDPGEVPVFVAVPLVEFAEGLSESTEGTAGTHNVTLTLDQPFSGTLNYRIGSESTVTAGQDFQSLPLSVSVSGTSAVIPISWIDDDQISPSRLLFLEIEDGAGYAVGGQARHIVLLSDNDAWWDGVVADQYAQRNFRLKITRDSSGMAACFAAGAGNDGLPTLEGETPGAESNQSVGLIPDGVFPVTVVADTASHFEIASPTMPAATGGLFGASTGLGRTLVLKSIPVASPPNNQLIGPARIIGEYTECLALSGQPTCAEQSGTFIIVRELPDPPAIAP